MTERDTKTSSVFDGLLRLVGSSKAIVAVGAIIVVAVLAHLGKVPGDEALGFVKWIVGFFVGAVAIEDAAKKLGTDKAASVVAAVQDLERTVSTLTGVLGEDDEDDEDEEEEDDEDE